MFHEGEHDQGNLLVANHDGHESHDVSVGQVHHADALRQEVNPVLVDPRHCWEKGRF